MGARVHREAYMAGRQRIPALMGGLLVALMVLFGGGAGLAQDATPADTAAAHPAHIHTGTCDTLGDVVFPLNDVAVPGAATPDAGTAATPAAAGAPIVALS